MMPDLYSDALLAAAAQLPDACALAAPDARATKTSRICGSAVSVELCVETDPLETDPLETGRLETGRLETGRISAFAVDAHACALGQASAAIVARHIIGTSVAQFKEISAQTEAMLRSGGPPPATPPWVALAALEPIKEYPARHKSTLLVFEAVLDCLAQLEGG